MKRFLKSLIIAVTGIAAATALPGQTYAISPVAGYNANCPGSVLGDGGPASLSCFQSSFAMSVATDAAGNVYVANFDRIHKITTDGNIAVFAGGNKPGVGTQQDGLPATGAYIAYPNNATTDAAGNVYFLDGAGIQWVDTKGLIHTVTNSSGQALPSFIQSLTSDSSGNLYYVDPNPGGGLRKITPGGTVTSIGGGGLSDSDGVPATSAILRNPQALTVDSQGTIYLVVAGPTNGSLVRKIVNGLIYTVAGGGASGTQPPDGSKAIGAYIGSPVGLSVDSTGAIYIADDGYNGNSGAAEVRKVATDGTISVAAGGGTGSQTAGSPKAAKTISLRDVTSLAVGLNGSVYIVNSFNGNPGISVLNPQAAPPTITTNGVVPVYSTVPTVQPGEWVSIYGTNLASSTVTWKGDFPTNLGGTSVTIDGKAAYLWFVSPTQINLQVPLDTNTGSVPVVVTTSAGTSTSTVTLAQFAPSFSLLDSKHVTGIILRANGSGAYGGGVYDIIGPTGSSLGYPTIAAKAGDSIELFGVGFGPTNPAVTPGQIYSGAAQTTNTVTLTINGTTVNPTFAGLSSAGLYQINSTVPANLGTGDVSLQASVGGVKTPTGVVISLQ